MSENIVETTEEENEDEIQIAKPVVNTKKSGKNGSTLVIACGQGGSRLGNAIAIYFNSSENSVYINTSMRDIDGLGIKDTKRLIKVGNSATVEGAGKDNGVGNRLLAENKMQLFENIKEKMLEKEYDFVFVVFSTSGGTGSAMGPKITAIVNSDMIMNQVKEKFGKIPLVFGIAALPEICIDEGNLSYKNTLLCMDDIKKFVTNETARFILVNNGYDIVGQKNHNRVAKLDAVNVSVAIVLNRYFEKYGTSRISNFDKADRYGALTTMGLHSFMVLENTGDRKAALNPFFIPDGERVKRVCYEVPEIMEKIVDNAIAATGAIYDDQIHGLYDMEVKENAGLLPIVGFHGFKNVEKISEQYDKRIKLNEENAKRIEKSNVSASTGLDNVKEVVENAEKEYGRHGAQSLDDIF